MIQTFMRLLYNELITSSEPMFGWLCPNIVRDDGCLRNKTELKEYPGMSLKASSRLGYKIILLPYIETAHWTLIAICLSRNEVNHFDSLRKQPPRSLLIKSLLNSLMKDVSAKGLRASKSPVWKSVECPQQQDGLACGYHVMRYMFDIVNHCTKVDDLRKVYKNNTPSLRAFTKEEIDEVQDKLASYITDDCLWYILARIY
ncbi:uncharacterized protein LOC130590344 [Beta vulgaris subsp. vulgaris]|uniref:uncharacterized protein LOC130590344 n=1 Tax=Beta vulgaris subsp. vulgaris TaxID=3555 RepID=UPI0025496F63|nr:uncharacterized protein LOC130590344 [Beta vulgaris subsp. vulgaris]